jgi:secreted PhoX family phosphatase
VTDDVRQVAFYMGDDERNEYIYKFICERPYNPRNRKDNLDLLDHGTLYVAKFTSQGVPGKQGTHRGAWTMMDRPEWTAARPRRTATGRSRSSPPPPPVPRCPTARQAPSSFIDAGDHQAVVGS